MKLRKKTKGFTIIELVIVIAVIAVLAAVLIPTFINLTAKANKAADDSLVTNLNTALATQEQVLGDTKNETMHDAVEDLKDYGYLLPNLVTKSEDKLLWDQKSNRFLLEKEAKEDKTLDYWRIQNNLDEQKYNVYAGVSFSASAEKLAALSVGFDAGYTEGLTGLKYVGGEDNQEVTIRTNGGFLEIDSASDKVHHFGSADGVVITAVAPTSYYENGVAGYVNIKNGRLVIEEKAQIDGVYLKDTDGDFNGIKIAVVGKAILPQFARADVALNNGDSKLVVELQVLKDSKSVDDNPEYVWISKANNEVASKVSSSSSSIVEVPQPTAAAAAVKEETKQAANPINANSIARIGAVGYATFDAAANYAYANGGKIVVLNDITYGVDRSVPVWDTSFDIDLGGKTFTTNSEVSIDQGNNGYKASAICFGNAVVAQKATISNGVIRTAYGTGIYASDAVTVTIKDVDITQNYPENVQSTYEYSSAIRLTCEAKVIVESGSFKGKYSLAVSNSGGIVTINGGTFYNDLFFSSSTDSGVEKSITINGGSFTDFNVINSNKGTLVINGGTFSSTHYTLEQFNAFVAEGKSVITNSDGSWTVK